MMSVVGGDVDIVAAQLGNVHGDRLNRRHAKWAARANIEAGPVARALDLAADQITLRKRTTVMSADIVDGVKTTVNVEHGNRSAVNLDQFFAPWGQFGSSRDFDKC
jgi:hypothetical protein